MMRCLIGLSIIGSILALTLPILSEVLRHAFTDDRTAWYRSKADDKKPYICKKASAENCDADWSFFQSHCYTARYDVKSRANARLACENMSSSLASIHSDAENLYASALCMKLSGRADGFDDDGRPSCFIGLIQATRGSQEWSWDDGSYVNYTNWGRAPNLVGPFPAVTLNGDWVYNGSMTMMSLVINAIVMCVSTAALIYASYARSREAFRFSLKGDALCSLMCLAAIGIWAQGYSVKDSARNVPIILICALQELTMCLILGIQFLSAGFEPKWHVKDPPLSWNDQPNSAKIQVQPQPQTLPAMDA